MQNKDNMLEPGEVSAEGGTNESLDDILSSIKDVIKDNTPAIDVLELTDKIEEATDTSTSGSSDLNTRAPSKITPNLNINLTAEEEANDAFTATSPKTTSENLVLDQILNSSKENDFQPSESKNLLDDHLAAETRAAVSNILKTTKQDTSPKLRSGTTVEDLIIEILKPELKVWLNNNLPSLVKSVVEKEVRKLLPKDE